MVAFLYIFNIIFEGYIWSCSYKQGGARRKRKVKEKWGKGNGGKEKRKRGNKRKGKKKREEKGGRKKRKLPTLQEVGFFSYLGCLYLGVIQWPWSLALTLGLAQNSLEQTVWVSGFFWFQKYSFGVG